MLASLELPRNGAEAAAMASVPGSVVLGGGTVVMPLVLEGGHAWTRLVALRRSGLTGIDSEGGRIGIGAATTLADLEEHPALGFLADALASIGSPNLRNLATVGGNLFVAQPYGDLAVCLLALGAEATIQTSSGEEVMPVEHLVTLQAPPGIVTRVTFDVPAPGNWFYRKAGRRAMNTASIVTVAARIERQGDLVAAARIALGGCGPRPVRAQAAEAALVGQPLDRVAVEMAGQAALGDASPFSDAYASAWYRARVLPVHLRRALLGE
jgi:CO/xanthine dehydrogenase FAD-binding subunit